MLYNNGDISRVMIKDVISYTNLTLNSQWIDINLINLPLVIKE